jgi:hypothetical protein
VLSRGRRKLCVPTRDLSVSKLYRPPIGLKHLVCTPPNEKHCRCQQGKCAAQQGSLGTYEGRLRSRPMARSLHHQIIARALELIKDEVHWTRAAIARTANGEVCETDDPRAARFCAIGALSRAVQELGPSLNVFKTSEFILAANNSPNDSLARINDTHGHAAVVKMFNRALAGLSSPTKVAVAKA